MTSARLFCPVSRTAGVTARAPGEKDEPRDFVVDLDLEVDAERDSIEATADYRACRRRSAR